MLKFFLIIFLIISFVIQTVARSTVQENKIITRNNSFLIAQADQEKQDGEDDLALELGDVDQEVTDEFEDNLESELEGELEEDFADIPNEEPFDLDENAEKKAEQLIEEEFEQQLAETEEKTEPPLEDIESTSPAETLPEDETLVDIEDTESTIEEPIELTQQIPSTTTDGPLLNVTGVDFLHDQAGGTIVIQTTGIPQNPFIRKSEDGRQIIVEIDNLKIPSQFKRPYATRDFPSNIGFFQAYQDNESTKARFVISIRDPIEPIVRVDGNSILVEAQDSNTTTGSLADTQQLLEDSELQEANDMASKSPLNAESSDDFLSQNVRYTGVPISIEVNNANIRDVLKFITRESGLNIVLSENITGKVSLELKEIPWDQVFLLVLQMKKLGYIRSENILIVDTIDNIRTEMKNRQQLIESKKSLSPLQIQFIPVSYAKANDLVNRIQIFKGPKGQIQSDPRTNSLMITDTLENINRMKRLIRTLDVQIPQILIEAKIVEATEVFSRRFGMIIKGQNLGSIVKGFVLDRGGGGIPLDFDLSTIVGLSQGALTATLDLLEEDQVVKVISSPRVVTLNNMSANINQTDQIPLAKTDSTGGGISQSTEYKNITFSLNVTPQVTSGKGIILQINIQRQFAGAAASDGEAPPIFGRSASTNVLVNNGDTAVIGGMYQDSMDKNNSGVPVLRHIPILGSLFKRNTYSSNKAELLIFITPRILNRNEIFASSTLSGEVNSTNNSIDSNDIDDIELELEEEFDNL